MDLYENLDSGADPLPPFASNDLDIEMGGIAFGADSLNQANLFSGQLSGEVGETSFEDQFQEGVSDEAFRDLVGSGEVELSELGLQVEGREQWEQIRNQQLEELRQNEIVGRSNQLPQHQSLITGQQDAYINSTGSLADISTRRKPVPVQRITVNDFVIHPPKRPSIPSLRFNGLDPQAASDELGLGTKRKTLDWANTANVAEMIQRTEKYQEYIHLEPENFHVVQHLKRKEPHSPGLDYPPGDSAALCLASQKTIELNPMGVEEKNDLHRYEVFQRIQNGLRIRNLDPPPEIDNRGKQALHRTSIIFANLAISKILPAKERIESEIFERVMQIEDDDSDDCTFCLFDSEFGILDGRVWLDPDCSPGYCGECHNSTNLFDVAWINMVQEKYLRLDGITRENDSTVSRSRMNQLVRLGDNRVRPLKEFIEQEKAAEKLKENSMLSKAAAAQNVCAEDYDGMNFDSNIMEGIVAPHRPDTRVALQNIGSHQASDPRYGREQVQLRQHQGGEQLHSQQNQNSMGAGTEHQLNAILAPGINSSPQKLVPNSSNNQDRGSDYGPMNLRGGGGEDLSNQDSGDELTDLLPEITTPRNSGKAPPGSTISQSRQFGTKGPRLVDRSTPTPAARTQPFSTTAGGKRPYLTRQPAIKHDPDAEEQNDDYEDDDKSEEEKTGQLSGNQLFGRGKNVQAAMMKQADGKNTPLAPTSSTQRGNSTSAKSNTGASSTSKANSRSNYSATTPRLKQGMSSGPDSSEPPSKKARSKGPGRLLSLAEELAANPDYIIPAPPVSEGLTTQQMAKALSDGEKAARAKGLQIPRSLAEVEAQGLVEIKLTSIRQKKFNEATQRYRSYYGNRYEEQQAKFKAEGRVVVSSPWKVPKNTPSTGSMSGLLGTPAPRNTSSPVSVDSPNDAVNASASRKLTKNTGLSFAGDMAQTGTRKPSPLPARRRSSVKPGNNSGASSATDPSSSQPQFLLPDSASSGRTISASPKPRQTTLKNINRLDPLSASNMLWAASNDNIAATRPSASPGAQRKHPANSVEKFGLPLAKDQWQTPPAGSMASPGSSSGFPPTRRGAKPVVSSTGLANLRTGRNDSMGDSAFTQSSQTTYASPPVNTIQIQDRSTAMGPPSNGISPQPRSVVRPAKRLSTGSKAPSIHAGSNPRHRKQTLPGSLSHSRPVGSQGGTIDRRKAVAHEIHTPRHPSGLRQSQVQSPMAQDQPQFPHPEFISHIPHAVNQYFPHHQFVESAHNVGPPRPPRAASATTNIGNRDGILFCRGSPWSQIDVTKARICNSCRADKIAVIMHRHYEFLQISQLEGADNGYFPQDNNKSLFMGKKLRMCMICPGRAIWVCKECPLRLCECCKAHMVNMCKGKVENLLMHFYRMHVRNDAFLLRSDGGGF